MSCDKCTLNGCPKVPGYGPKEAKIVFVGEAPGDDEVRTGRPFTGPSGKLLNRVMTEAGLKREECYLTNACICRPEPQRAPRAKEIDCCRQRLLDEVSSRRPAVVVALGNVATRALLGSGRKLSDCRGAVESSEEVGAFVIPTYHPAAVLRSPSLWFDLVKDVSRAVEIIENPPAPQVVLDEVQITLVETLDGIRKMVDTIKSNGVTEIALDVETDSKGGILCIGLGWTYSSVYVVTGAVLKDCEAQRLLYTALESLPLIGHNLKYDLKVLRRSGFPWLYAGFDTMLAHYTQDERRGTHGLKSLAREFLGLPDYERAVAAYRNRMEDCPRDLLYRYNASDVVCTLALADYLLDRLGPQEKTILYDLLLPASDVLMKMEYLGVRVDMDHLKTLKVALSEAIEALEKRAQELANVKFNLNSPKQLMKVLYTDLGLPIPGEFTTNEEALKALTRFHDLPGVVLEYRKKRKLLSTYVEAIMDAADEDHRVHTTFNLHGTVTGRLSSSDPVNLQNIPTEEPMRNIFIATPGWVLVKGDLSQAEVRVLAEYTKDPALIGNLEEGGDIHRQMACHMFGLRKDEVTEEQRQAAKRLTFAVIYGLSPASLARELGITEAEAAKLIEDFFRKYPTIRKWMRSVEEMALTYGEVRTLLGRTRRFGLITQQNRGEVLRQAVNTPIQSVASDITLKALIRFGEAIQDRDDVRLLLTVHDEILAETRSDPREVAFLLKETMLEAAREVVSVPFEVKVSIGQKWGALTEVETKAAMCNV